MSNYTDEMVARIRAVYQPEAAEDVRTAQIEELAKEFGVSTRSIIGKLTTERDEDGNSLYVPKAKVAKTVKESEATRADIVAEIAMMLGVAADSLVSFTRTNRGELVALRDSIGKIVG